MLEQPEKKLNFVASHQENQSQMMVDQEQEVLSADGIKSHRNQDYAKKIET